MKLLLDQNISHRILPAIEPTFPGSAHVRDVGLVSANDDQVWEFARAGGFAIVSKDADFHQRSLVRGAPPKVIWLRRGNCSTADILALLTQNRQDLITLDSDAAASFLALG